MEPEAAPHGCLEPLTYKKPFDSQLARPDVAEPFCRSSRAAEAALLAGKLSIDSGYPDAGLPPEEVRTTLDPLGQVTCSRVGHRGVSGVASRYSLRHSFSFDRLSQMSSTSLKYYISSQMRLAGCPFIQF